MNKGQVGSLTTLAYGLMAMGIVFAVGLVVLSQFQTVVAPDQLTTLDNSTNLAVVTLMSNQTHLIRFADGDYGRFLNGSLAVVTDTNGSSSAALQNWTVWVNSNLIGLGNGYNTSKSLALTAAQLVNNQNNVTIYHGNSTNITSSTIYFEWEKWQDTDATDTAGDVIDVYGDVVDWLPIIVIVLIIVLILALLGFGGMGARR